MHLLHLRPLLLGAAAAVALVLTTAPAAASGSCGNSGPYLQHDQHRRYQHGWQTHGGYRSEHARYVRYQPKPYHGHHKAHGYRGHRSYPSHGYRRGTSLGYQHGHRHGSHYRHRYGCRCGCR